MGGCLAKAQRDEPIVLEGEKNQQAGSVQPQRHRDSASSVAAHPLSNKPKQLDTSQDTADELDAAMSMKQAQTAPQMPANQRSSASQVAIASVSGKESTDHELPRAISSGKGSRGSKDTLQLQFESRRRLQTKPNALLSGSGGCVPLGPARTQGAEDIEDTSFNATNGAVSPRLADMLELVARLLCPDLILLALRGPPVRVFVRDDAGIRPGALPHCIPSKVEVQLHASDGRHLGRLAIASRTLQKTSDADGRLLTKLGGKVATVLEAEADGSDCSPRRTSNDSAHCAASVREIVNGASGDLEDALINETLLSAAAHLAPAPREAVMLVGLEVGPLQRGCRGEWQAYCCDRSIMQMTGVRQGSFLSHPLWEVLEPPCPTSSPSWLAICEVAARRGEFFLHGIRPRDRPGTGSFALRFRPSEAATVEDWKALTARTATSTFTIASLASKPQGLFIVTVTADEVLVPERPAARRLSLQIDANNGADPSHANAAMTYIAFRRDAAAGASGPRPPGGAARSSMPPVPILGLTLGRHLGAGSFGNVFLGTWRGQAVAVKVCERGISASAARSVKPWRNVESSMHNKLSHEHLVRTLTHSTVLVAAPRPAPLQPLPLPPPPSAAAPPDGQQRRRSTDDDLRGRRPPLRSSRPIHLTPDITRRMSMDSAAAASVSAASAPKVTVVFGEPRGAPTDVPAAGRGAPVAGVPAGPGYSGMSRGQLIAGSPQAASAAAQSLFAAAAAAAAAPQQSSMRALSHGCVLPPQRHSLDTVKETAASGSGCSANEHSQRYSLDSLSTRSQVLRIYQEAEAEPVSGEAEVETWIVMQYCSSDLKAALEEGRFRVTPSLGGSSPPNIPAIMLAATQIASALAYLHSHDIIHGDLSLSNVLLADDEGPICCKVADLGLSRETGKSVVTKTCGRITYAPPELMREGRLSPAADVFAFGVLVSELLAGLPAWEDMKSHASIVAAVIGGRRAPLPAQTPPWLEALLGRCQLEDPRERPTFVQIVEELGRCTAAPTQE